MVVVIHIILFERRERQGGGGRGEGEGRGSKIKDPPGNETKTVNVD